MLAQEHSAGHDASSQQDSSAQPPQGIEAEQFREGYQRTDQPSCSGRVDTHFPFDVQQDAATLYEQGCHDDATYEMWDVYVFQDIEAN